MTVVQKKLQVEHIKHNSNAKSTNVSAIWVIRVFLVIPVDYRARQ